MAVERHVVAMIPNISIRCRVVVAIGFSELLACGSRVLYVSVLLYTNLKVLLTVSVRISHQSSGVTLIASWHTFHAMHALEPAIRRG